MALLIYELILLPQDYRPTEEELARARELLAELGAAVKNWEPEKEIPAAAPAPEPKTDNRKPKTGK